MHWLRQVLIAIDQIVNALLAGWGRQQRAINALFFWQADHCRGAFAAEVERRQMPPMYRNNVRE